MRIGQKRGIGSIAAVLLLLLLLFVFKIYKGNHQSNTNEHNGQNQQLIPADVPLIYTKHARCRMKCRHIDEEEIREVLREGIINEAKSKVEQGKCPSYAIEDEVKGHQLRVVFAKCESEVKVVTCIDIGKEFQCDCN